MYIDAFFFLFFLTPYNVKKKLKKYSLPTCLYSENIPNNFKWIRNNNQTSHITEASSFLFLARKFTFLSFSSSFFVPLYLFLSPLYKRLNLLLKFSLKSGWLRGQISTQVNIANRLFVLITITNLIYYTKIKVYSYIYNIREMLRRLLKWDST